MSTWFLMRKLLGRLAVPAILLGSLWSTRAAAAAPEPAGMLTPAVLRELVVSQIADGRKKLVELAEAVPAEQFSWRPVPAAQSVSEICTHVAGMNFYLPTQWGAKLPAGVNLRALFSEAADKDTAVARLTQSFDFLLEAVTALPEAEFGKSMTIFDHQGTVAEGMLVVTIHLHEHLGQLLSYTCMNDVVPPWKTAEVAAGTRKIARACG